MFVNRIRQEVIYTPFKVFSTSTRAYLEEQDDWVEAIGCQPHSSWEDARFSVHNHILEHRVANYKKILPIRDPYARVISQYKWRCKRLGEISFEDWFMLESRQCVLSAVTEIYKYDQLMTLDDMIQQWPGFPHENHIEKEVIIPSQFIPIIDYIHYSDFQAIKELGRPVR